jgi:hypothetical protein
MRIYQEKLEGGFIVTRLFGIPIFKWLASKNMIIMANHFNKWDEYIKSENYVKVKSIEEKVLNEREQMLIGRKESQKVFISKQEYDLLCEYNKRMTVGMPERMTMLFGMDLVIEA